MWEERKEWREETGYQLGLLIPARLPRTRVIFCAGISDVLNEDVIRNYAGKWNYANIKDCGTSWRMLYRQGIMGNFWWQYRLPGHERLTGKPSSWCLAVITLINTAFNFGVAESIFCTVSLKLNNCPNSTSSRRFRPHQCKLHLSFS